MEAGIERKLLIERQKLSALLEITNSVNKNYQMSDLLSQFEMKGKAPKSIIHVTIDAVYFQCARALIRSELWNLEKQFSKTDIPSAGQMMQAVKSDFDGDEYERILPQRQQDTLY